jgi:L-threonylcarbamoyladenylate synthase
MSKPVARARLYRGTPRNLAALAGALRRGELVAVPTETVYGLAANALDARACRKIFTAKGRPASDPLIIHILDHADLDRVARSNDAARILARRFWPGPLTLVLPRQPAVPDAVTAGRSSVAVRMPQHPLLRRLMRLTGRPLAAPSANPFGYVSPTTAEHVRAGLGRKVRHVLNGGPSAIGLESTIIDLRDPRKPRLLRPGAITRAQLERALGLPVPPPRTSRRVVRGAQLAPGMLARHYSPRTPLVLHRRIDPRNVRADKSRRTAWLFIAKPRGLAGANVRWLDPRGDLHGAGRKLFGALRSLDAGGFKSIHAELAPGGGLSAAINDRLRRAAARD